MVSIKNKEQIDATKEGGKILGEILKTASNFVQAGVETKEIDSLIEKLITEKGGRPSFKGYSNGGSKFPSSACICLNNEIVHGPAVPSRMISDGDIVSIDIGMEYKKMYTDTATTVIVGEVGDKTKKLVKVTEKSLELGIKKIKPGAFLHEISIAVQKHVEDNGFGVVRDLVGHGVGFAVHEDPQIPNYFDPKQKKIVLKEGMMLAIEPMVVTGDVYTKTLKNGWTAVATDGGMSAHFEHTVVVINSGVEVLTRVG